MRDVSCRPFYAEYAWAFDLLIDRPVRKECAVIVGWLTDRGITPGAEILDAGCGTGRYALELARRGYRVRGIDLSPDIVDDAERDAVFAAFSQALQPNGVLILDVREWGRLIGAQDPGADLQKAGLDRTG